MVTPTPFTALGFNCRNCGAAVALRALQHTRAVACTTCGAILDPRDPNVCVLQKAAAKEFVRPDIPLGTRGTLQGQPWEVVGFQRRSIEVDDVRYSWDEYVLFNPYRGFRYLSNYEGHWNDIRTVRELPQPTEAGKQPQVLYKGDIYSQFQIATARTDYVLGEFPWRVRTDDIVEVIDYICPPRLLSREGTDNEATWSLGTYTDAQEIWAAFGVHGSPLNPSGVFANQPSPYAKDARLTYRTFFALAALLCVLLLGRIATAGREPLISGTYVYRPQGDAAFVTESFTLRRPGTVEIAFHANLNNAWLAFDVALIDVKAGTARNVARELSFYQGHDGEGGVWSEGSRKGRLLLPTVPAGEYYLRVEPEGQVPGPSIPYTMQVRLDVPSYIPYAIALVLLLMPPLLVGWKSWSFEHRRMQESSYGDSE